MTLSRPFLTRLALVFAMILPCPAFAAQGDDDADDVSAQGRRRGPRASVIFYERPNFSGASLEFDLPAEVMDLSSLRFPNGSRVNDRVSSIEIARGAQVKIYVGDGFEGEFLELTRSVENLATLARAGGQNWNDTISSFRIFERRHGRDRDRDPSRTPRIIVFSSHDFSGEAYEIFPGERLDNLHHEHFETGKDLGDEISSIRVVGPLRVRLYSDKRCVGESVEVTADIANLATLRRGASRKGWHNEASSLVVEWAGPPRRLDGEPADDDEADTPPPPPPADRKDKGDKGGRGTKPPPGNPTVNPGSL